MTDNKELPKYIGTAFLEEDGTLILSLRAEGDGGMVGHGQFTYKPEEAKYQEIIDHIGGITPGESKPVPPWS